MGDAGVVELCEDFGFSLKTGEAFFVLGEGFGQDFDGNFTSELGIPGAVDLSHSTGTNGLEDFVET